MLINVSVSSVICDRREDFDFDIVNFQILDGDTLNLHLFEFTSYCYQIALA